MFNLEQSITQWRQQMLAAGIKSPALDELENHLREETDRQIKSGISQPLAFEMAVKIIGRGVELKKEFKKAEPLAGRLVKLLSIGCGSISFMLSLWFSLFIFKMGLEPFILGLAALATSILFWKYSYKFLPAIRPDLIRAMTGIACCVGSVFWIQLFLLDVVPNLAEHQPGMEINYGRLLATVLWGCTAMAVLSGIGYGLEKSAREREGVNT